jgi:O-antigen biosynthesis protein
LTKLIPLLSVIIVNYNVKYFLEQCLFSVRAAMKQVGGEVIVVDNASQDGSRDYLASRFPEVQFIWNKENLGFARANNLALAQSKGEHILFLNPDTIVAEDCFSICMQFMHAHPQAGALGVHMVDGGGRFLKESKRAYPSISTSFFKLAGLATLFPKSKIFARYHLGHLDPASNHEVDVLAGAFMWVRRKALDAVGSFDERFFMYGEDIDLSYRLQRGGWKNFYVADTTVIHFKGESTKRGSLNYVRMFYRAMAVFVEKHYTSVTAFFFRFFITLAIWFRAGITAVLGGLKQLGLPIIDAVNILIAFIAAKYTWNELVKPEIVYNRDLLGMAFPAFTVVFIVAAYYAGLYDRSQKRGRVIHSTVIATTALLVIYALLPEQYRFSRAILLLGSFYAFILLVLSRGWMRRLNLIEAEEEEKLGTVVVADLASFEEASGLMETAEKRQRILGRIAPQEDGGASLTTLGHLDAFLKDVPVREVIFCQGRISYQEIIRHAQKLPKHTRMRIMAGGAKSIVGSDSSTSSGQAISDAAGYNLGGPSARRMKQLVDALAALLFIVTWPLQLFLVKNPIGLLGNAMKVLGGQCTWIGYSSIMSNHNGLPRIKKGILGTNGQPGCGHPDADDGLYKLDQLYAREYTIYKDLYLMAKGYKWLGS